MNGAEINENPQRAYSVNGFILHAVSRFNSSKLYFDRHLLLIWHLYQ